MSFELWTSSSGMCRSTDVTLRRACPYIDEASCITSACCWGESNTTGPRCYHQDAVKLGKLTIDNFALGANLAGTYVTHFPKVKAVYTPPSGSYAAAGRKFLSSFVQGKDQTVMIRGAADGSGTS